MAIIFGALMLHLVSAQNGKKMIYFFNINEIHTKLGIIRLSLTEKAKTNSFRLEMTDTGTPSLSGVGVA